jgi:DNA-binding PadR family transcriptional regulator
LIYPESTVIREGAIVPPDSQPTAALTSAELNILLALADGEQHGYAIMLDINNRTNGRFRIGPGTLYGTIKRLLRRKLICRGTERADLKLGDERRRYYQLTPAGRLVLAGEIQRLAQIVSIARKKRVFTGAVSAAGGAA